MSVNAYQVYKKTQISTASQGDLVIMLFEGAIRFANQAKDFINEKNLEQANEKITRTQDIISELINALDLDTGEIAHNLYQLYTFVNEQLVQANVKKDVVILDQAISFLVELRDTWRLVVNPKQ